MNRNNDFLVSQSIKIPPSEEEIELFNSYKEHLDRDFQLFKQANMALTAQENELSDARALLLRKYEEYECKKQNALDVLNIINKEIDIARGTLNDTKRQMNSYKRQVRFLERKIVQLKLCIPPEKKN